MRLVAVCLRSGLALALAASFAEEGGGGASFREAPGSSPGPEAAADAAWSGDAPRFSLIIDLNWIIHELRCVSSGSLQVVGRGGG